MMNFEFNKWIRENRVKLAIVSFILFLSALFAENQVYTFMHMSGLIPEGAILTVIDYLIGMLNAPQFFMFFLYPVLFSLLTSDLIRADTNHNFISYILPRYSNRKDYLIMKYKLMICLAVLFIMMIIGISVMTWMITGVPISGEIYHYIFLEAEYNDKSIFVIFANIILRFIIGLMMIGFISMFFSILFNRIVAVGFIVILGYLHNAFYVTTSLGIITLPFTQYVYGLQYVYSPFGIPIPFFNSLYSITYMVIMIIIIGIFTLNSLKKLEL